MSLALRSAIAVGLLFGAVSAYAQDSCEAPAPIASNQTVTGLSTCGHPNGVGGYGGYASPQPDYIFSFTAQDANATITLTTSAALVEFLVSSCSAGVAGAAIGSGAPGDQFPMTVSGLNNGQQYWIGVTSQPGPNDQCGDFGLAVAGQLPVSLQSFSID